MNLHVNKGACWHWDYSTDMKSVKPRPWHISRRREMFVMKLLKRLPYLEHYRDHEDFSFEIHSRESSWNKWNLIQWRRSVWGGGVEGTYLPIEYFYGQYYRFCLTVSKFTLINKSQILCFYNLTCCNARLFKEDSRVYIYICKDCYC